MSIWLLRLFYGLMLGSLAALIPLLGGRFEREGLDGVTIGLLMALLPLGRLLSVPLWAWWADRYQAAGLVLRVSCVASAAAGMVVARAESVWALGLAMFLFAAMRAPVGAITDVFVMESLRSRGRPLAEYGRVRLFGSLGFMVGVLLASVPFSGHWLSDASLVATAIVAFAFPTRGAGGPAPVWPALVALVRQPWLLPLLLAGCLQAFTLSVYDCFLSVHVAALGMPEWVVGAAFAVGVACEIALMAWARPVLGRLGPAGGLFLAAAVNVPRWALTAWTSDPVVLVGVQVIHGVAFGAFWVSGVQRMAQGAPVQVAASAQSLWSAASYGVGSLAGQALAGEARELGGTAAIFEMLACVSVLATVAAGWLWRVDRRPG
ncbi:MAG: MFS transporter [Deltaproteobacteria bacterium]|nr:MFS transporter [Deltaproteobacteria bacterium]